MYFECIVKLGGVISSGTFGFQFYSGFAVLKNSHKNCIY